MMTFDKPEKKKYTYSMVQYVELQRRQALLARNMVAARNIVAAKNKQII